jgi:transcriptional regulator with XRE-family HTH domain
MLKEEEAALRKKMVGVLMRNARLRSSLSIKEVAGITGFSTGAISDHEYGRRDISLPQLEVLAHLYRVPIAYFWDENALDENGERALPVDEVVGLRRRILGTLLRQARMEAGHSQSELARHLDCPPARIFNYEFGRADIPLIELEQLARILEVPMSYFFDKGIKSNGDQVPDYDELSRLAELPEDVRRFMLHPGNLLYVRIAMQLNTLSANTLRRLGEGLLDITD